MKPTNSANSAKNAKCTKAQTAPNTNAMTKALLSEQRLEMTKHLKDEFEPFVRLYILRLIVRYSDIDDFLEHKSRVLSFFEIDLDASAPNQMPNRSTKHTANYTPNHTPNSAPNQAPNSTPNHDICASESLMEHFAALLIRQERKPLPQTRLDHNLALLQDSLRLSHAQKEIVRLSIIIDRNILLADILERLSTHNKKEESILQICIMLNLPLKDAQDSVSKNSILSKSNFVNFRRNYNLVDALEPLDEHFSERMLVPQKSIEPLVSNAIIQAQDSSLSLNDYTHLQKQVAIIKAHLQSALLESAQGVNILLYGPPGTGKSELSRLLPQVLGARCFEVNFIDEDEDGEMLSSSRRIRAYNSAQNLLNTQKTILVFDEVEDILTTSKEGHQEGKAWFNNALETNNIPTIWITNNIRIIDDALIRRFDCVLKMGYPSKKRQKEILNSALAKLELELELDSRAREKFIKKYAKQKYLSPAIITRAIKVAISCKQAESSAESKMTRKATLKAESKAARDSMQDSASSLEILSRLINSTLKAQGNYIKPASKKDKKKRDDYTLPKHYSLAFVNCDENLESLAQGIARVKNARICLYGAPGTGKSAYGRYIAKLLGAPCVLKRASDLKSMWVGMTEKNIASAFKEARKKKAVLIFDEVDSFLHDRAGASRSWEISAVNEMLTQMESFDGVFIATTNLMENLDSASLRRFDYKCEFRYLSAKQSAKLFTKECVRLGIESSGKAVDSRILDKVCALRNITPGDFAAIARAHRFKAFKNAAELFTALKNEALLKKDTTNANRIGF
ncbi:hypothetical protein BKN38_02485 [Helicobacter sp. CLO-3]|uniref:AAA family ATPase n=1 Tax=unclassified Helicobacter TaxID=2593540 RepID=UPI000805BBB6|nr:MULTISPECIES: ATP-binding protein [unclassified Helicobacter]OBV29433.1 hypothetical protein BA723_00550 [Helicobacter sp. CLO-3]OHU84671.1 hypothetical protein BKN38_02485 [Helicobacter sp. CLO-3]